MDCQHARDAILRHISDGSLQSPEAVNLLQHLSVCPACYEYLYSSSEAWHLLPYGVPEIAPPPELRERVLQQVAREKQGRTRSRWLKWLGGERLTGGSGTSGTDGSGTSGTGGVRGTDGISGSKGIAGISGWFTAAAVIVLLVLSGLWWQSYQVNQALLAEIQNSRAQLQAAATLLADTRQAPAEMVRLQNDGGYDEVWGVVSTYETRYGFVMVLSLGGLPAVESNGVYRVWLVKDGERTDGGSFRPDAAGYASVIRQMPSMEWDAIGITREPDTEALPEPRGPRVMFGQL